MEKKEAGSGSEASPVPGTAQREIKFRAWHPGSGKKLPAQMLYDEKPGDCLRWKSMGQPVEVMQFTGLRDRNGREIYEGDIVVTWNDDSALDTWEAKEYGEATVTMDIRGLHITDKTGFEWDWDSEESVYAVEFLEVIGNIFEGTPTP